MQRPELASESEPTRTRPAVTFLAAQHINRTMAYSDNRKNVKQQYLLQISPQYGELRPISGWDRFTSLGHLSKFQRISCLGFVTAVTSVTGGQPNFSQSLAISWTGTLWIHFRGCCPLTEFCQVQNSLCVQALRSHRIGSVKSTALQQRASAKLCGVVQVMELRNFRSGRNLCSAGRPS